MLLWAFLHHNIERWEYRELFKQYAVMIENIYEHSQHPDDHNIRRRAQRHRELLQESGNSEKITFHELYLQDDEHCNESWKTAANTTRKSSWRAGSGISITH